MVRTANPLEAEIALNKSPTFSLSFLNVAEFAAETVPVLEVSVASEVWPSAVLAKTQSPPIQSPQSNNQWFPIPIVATVDLASKEYVSDAVDVVKPDPPNVYVVTVDVDSIVQFLMWYPNEALKELPKKYLAFKP
jgi:hypothetical protein